MMEEIVAFGIMLLEMEAQDMDDAQQKRLDVRLQDGLKPQSFILWMLKSLVSAYFLSELEAMAEFVGTASNKAYIENPKYLLSHALLVDLQRICQVEADYGLLLSVSVLRDPEKCEMKLKQLMKPKIMFGGSYDDCQHFQCLRYFT
ncbi:unnamed protein product [Peronospora destructor]|uniref:Uncharacterized protein n=1 Tax=Peronospora destructor TaxID=86335 RepID=A0AAV0U292_9STRA|nr:unnamed protein product [Peronospora destructor]